MNYVTPCLKYTTKGKEGGREGEGIQSKQTIRSNRPSIVKVSDGLEIHKARYSSAKWELKL